MSIPFMEVIVTPGGPLKAGDTITCTLRLTSVSAIQVRSWEATFVREVRSLEFAPNRHPEGADGGRGASGTKSPLKRNISIRVHSRNFACFSDDDECGLFDPKKEEGRFPLSKDLPPGQLQVPFLIPDTWADPNPCKGTYSVDRSIRYKVRAKMTFSHLDDSLNPVGQPETMVKEADVVVKKDVDVCRFRSTSSPATQVTKGTLGFPGMGRGPIVSSLTISNRFLVVGENMQCEVNIRNNSPRDMRTIVLSLHQEVGFRNDSFRGKAAKKWTVTEKLAEKPLPSVNQGTKFHKVVPFMASWAELTSGSFTGYSHFFIKFYVCLSVKWCFGSIQSNVEVFLGTTRSEDDRSQPGPDEASGSQQPQTHSPTKRRNVFTLAKSK